MDYYRSKSAFNVGIAFLRIVACFGVVNLHFGESLSFGNLSVPVFMLIAMFLGSQTIDCGDWGLLLKRISRLYIPFAAWGIISFGVSVCIKGKCDLMRLIEQLVWGHTVCPPLYFIVLLAVATVFLFLAKKIVIWRGGLILLFIACLTLQYTGINYTIFGDMPTYIGIPCGRFAELCPYAIAGLVCRSISKRENGLKWMLWIGVMLCVAYLLFMRLPPLVSIPSGFMYQGLPLMVGGIGVPAIGIAIGDILNSRINARVENIIRIASSLTAGIYYVHYLLGNMIEHCIGSHKSIVESLLVFVASGIVVSLFQRNPKLSWLVK